MKTEAHGRHDAEVQQRENDDLRRQLTNAKWMLLGYTAVTTADQTKRAESMARVWRDAAHRIGDAA